MGQRKRGFGQITKLPSGRYRARYTGPDGQRHSPRYTFDTALDAEAWLTAERRLLADPDREWTPPKQRENADRAPLTFGAYAEKWLAGRSLEVRTRAHYRNLLDQHLLPAFEDRPLRRITHDDVVEWHATTLLDRPTLRSHAYGLLRTILGSAEKADLIAKNPAYVRGAGNAKRVKRIKPATLPELEAIVTAMPDRYKTMTLLAAWCGLRFGELAELRRGDVNTRDGVLHVRRGVVRADGATIVKRPKSDAGVRDVAIPPHLLPMVREHLLQHAEAGKDGLLFPAKGGGHLAPSSLYRVFYRARDAAGRPDLRWHDLRHTGAVLAAQTGATLAELMARLGHSTPGAALRYQHAAQGRDMEIARKLSALVGGADA
ncbi:tyrosine-type recombinase/integrase [Nocardioides caldifontis]|uniref:tyrosine-type recombinase/integrase n=1 Tax=Nocardioides caldifontis TaxID=2588938 RepID=UPI0011DF3C65|nr:site-specific integrase [Nocardioides caldifontis]